MEKSIKKISVITLIWVSLVSMTWGKPLVINDLINKSQEFDQQEVTIEAEVIGDVMKRGEYTWLNVTDGSAAIGIYIETVQTEGIQQTGGYNQIGDTVKVTGVFHRAYDEQGGDLAIEAKQLEVIEKGKSIEENIPKWKFKLLGGVALLTGGIFIVRKVGHK